MIEARPERETHRHDSRGYTILGWLTWQIAKRVAKRKMGQNKAKLGGGAAALGLLAVGLIVAPRPPAATTTADRSAYSTTSESRPSSAGGNCGSIARSVSTRRVRTAQSRYQLRSAGMTYQGARLVEVSDSASPNAAM